MLDLGADHAAFRVLVAHPVLPAPVDYAAAGALQHVSKLRTGRNNQKLDMNQRRMRVCVSSYPDQAYLASPNHGLSEEAEVLGTTITSRPPS